MTMTSRSAGKEMASAGREAARPTRSRPSGCGPEFWNRFTGSGTTGRVIPADAAAASCPGSSGARAARGWHTSPGRRPGRACRAHPVRCRGPAAGSARRADRGTPRPARGTAARTGPWYDRPTATAVISGIDRPQVPDLMPLDVDHRDQRATARRGRAPGAGRHDHDPGGTAGFHHAMLAASPATGEPRRGTISPSDSRQSAPVPPRIWHAPFDA